MNAKLTYAKSVSGIDELANRTLKLPQSLRRVLILVDGTQDQEQLMLTAQKIGAPADAITQLLKMGLIAPVQDGVKLHAGATPAQLPLPATASPNHAPMSAPPNAASLSDKLSFDLGIAQRQLVKLIEKNLGPGGERIALSIEDAKDKPSFIVAAMRAKAILHKVAPASVNDPFWLTIGI